MYPMEATMAKSNFLVIGWTVCVISSVVCCVYFYLNEAPIRYNSSSLNASPSNSITSKSYDQETTATAAADVSSALRYCNFPSSTDFDSSEEGASPGDNLTLRQVLVVIRHGDRSPLNYKLYGRLRVVPKYCRLDPGRSPKEESLARFVKTITGDQRSMLGRLEKLPISPIPSSKICGPGMLSQLGVIQHIHNGKMLRQRYIERHNFLRNALRDRKQLQKAIYTVTTARTRTMQSAVGFLYGLLPDFHLYETKIAYSASDTFSSQRCAALSSMLPSIKKVQYQSYLGHRSKSSIKKLDAAFNAGDHTGVLIDGFVNGFLCKGFKLPCQGDVCTTLDDLNEIIEAEENTTRALIEESAYVNHSMLIIQPLLENLSKFMTKKLTPGNETGPDFVLMSGHDTTLKPLISALGIPEYGWPPLGSRLVFELWTGRDNNDGYVRVLLNGKDYTKDIRPCRLSGTDSGAVPVCPVANFHDYVRRGIALRFGHVSRQKACSSVGAD